MSCCINCHQRVVQSLWAFCCTCLLNLLKYPNQLEEVLTGERAVNISKQLVNFQFIINLHYLYLQVQIYKQIQIRYRQRACCVQSIVNKSWVLVLRNYCLIKVLRAICVCTAGVVLNISVVQWLTCSVVKSFPAVGLNQQ